MSYVIRRWYDIGVVVAAAAIVWVIVGGLDTIQVILLLNLVALVWHQVEEMRLPGGSPWVLNEVFNAQGGPADRYPLNQANCAFINIAAWIFYVIPVFFPGAIWLGIAQVLFGMVGQLLIHGIIINTKLKTLYNPGLAAVVFGHVPLGIWYLTEVHSRGHVTGWDWVFGVLTLAFFAGVIMKTIGYRLMVSKNTRYPFEPQEMTRWRRTERLTRAGITPLPLGTDGQNERTGSSQT